MNTISIITRPSAARAWVVLREAASQPFGNHSFDRLGGALTIEVDPVTENNWEDLTDKVQEATKAVGVRQAMVFGIGPAASLAQNLALRDPRLVRSLALLDPTSRPHPSRTSRVVDWIERKLPLGLPLRLGGKGFDARPFLQRLRCPLLVIVSPKADAYHREQARVFELCAPNAWSINLEAGNEETLPSLLQQVQDAPLRCPMGD